MTYTDWLGQEIHVGSTVMYAVSNSHYAQVVLAEVLEVIPVKPRKRDIYPEGVPPYWLGQRNPEYKPIGEEDYWPYGRTFKLKVQPLYESGPRQKGATVALDMGRFFGGERNDEGKYIWERCTPKPVFVQNIEKVTVFEFPPGVRARLDAHIDSYVEERNNR